MYDTTMVSEYSEEISQYMSELEVGFLTYRLFPSLIWVLLI